MKICKQHGREHMREGVCHATHIHPTQYHEEEEQSNTGTDLLSTMVAVEVASDLFSGSNDTTSTSIDTGSTGDFGGFDGGSSGGGGADSSW